MVYNKYINVHIYVYILMTFRPMLLVQKSLCYMLLLLSILFLCFLCFFLGNDKLKYPINSQCLSNESQVRSHWPLAFFSLNNVKLISRASPHWGRVTHICVSTITSIGSGILWIRPLGTNFGETFIKIHISSLITHLRNGVTIVPFNYVVIILCHVFII